jgi:hypothetical protein
MADDGQQPRDVPEEPPAEPVRQPAEPAEETEHTGESDPLAETDAESGSPESASPSAAAERRPVSDETMLLPGPSAGSASDQTVALPDRSAGPAGDVTAKLPRPPSDSLSRTATFPATRDGAVPPVAPWSGRAGVPPPGPPGVRGPTPAEWADEDGQPDRRWWLPIVVGLVALVLLGVLAFGIWLIAQANPGGTGPTPVSPSPAPSPTATAAPTSAAPTTPPATPTESAGAIVVVPGVIGLSQEEAQALLDQAGLTFQVQFRESTRTPGTVIGSDPRPSTPIAVGAQVTLMIAEPPATTPPPTTEAPATTAAPTPTG